MEREKYIDTVSGKELIRETRYLYGKIHREHYLINGKCHRRDGPAYINYYHNGQIHFEQYCMNGKEYREDGPAFISYYENNGAISCEEYYINGKLHRQDGPAVIRYHYDGKTTYEYYYINGEEITDEFQIMVIESLGME